MIEQQHLLNAIEEYRDNMLPWQNGSYLSFINAGYWYPVQTIMNRARGLAEIPVDGHNSHANIKALTMELLPGVIIRSVQYNGNGRVELSNSEKLDIMKDYTEAINNVL